MENRAEYLKREIDKAIRKARGADTSGHYLAASLYADKARMLFEELKKIEDYSESNGYFATKMVEED